MNTISCIIIDDEPLALRQLEMYIAKVPFLELVAACSSAAMAAPYVANFLSSMTTPWIFCSATSRCRG